ncbi:MAG: sensor histidine kinase [Syntrophobacteraceae bacterium]
MNSDSAMHGNYQAQIKLLLDALIEKDRICHTGKLVRGLIHNINGPLHNLSMLVEMMEQGQRQLDHLVDTQHDRDHESWHKLLTKQHERLDRLSRQVAALVDMLQDFMILQEIENSESDVDLPFVLKKLSKIFRADLFLKHQVEVHLELQENLPPVKIPGKDIVPALMHLFQNAILALHEAPEKKLTIQCLRQGSIIRVHFRDTGIGYDADVPEENLFELFYSGWPNKPEGLKNIEAPQGFGLYAVRRLMEPYGVKIELRREAGETQAVLEIPL